MRAAGEIEKSHLTARVTPAEPEAVYWKREAQKAKKALLEAEQARTAVEILVERAVELAPVAYDSAPAACKRAIKAKGSPQSAVLMLSDMHVGQCISPEQTLGLGNYSFEIFLRRLQRLEKSIFSILEDHTTTEVPEIVVAMIGDCLHGNLAHAVEAGQVNTLFDQFYAAGHAIAQFFRNISALAPIRVHTAVGNHPRWGTQRKMPTDNRYSNLDQFLYAYLAALLRENKRINFNLNKQPFALFEVQGHNFYAGHGDNLRGGDKALGIPSHAIGRHISNTTQTFSRAGKSVPNFYLFGHMHKPITLPHASGKVIVNGGFPGVDGFGLMENFTPPEPCQKLFLMHRKFGRAASYDLLLTPGDDTPHSYTLPEGFGCR